MQNDLWETNTVQRFWMCQAHIPDSLWVEAVHLAFPVLNLAIPPPDQAALTRLILGEGQFGNRHWDLPLVLKMYYHVKPVLPRKVIEFLKLLNSKVAYQSFPLKWPVEDRYALFLWETLRQVMLQLEWSDLPYRRFWPAPFDFCLVLTHDVETLNGQNFVPRLAQLEEQYGFRSSFNFVGEDYPLDYDLIADLRARGFEVGVHGLNHDGKLFLSRRSFLNQAPRINQRLQDLHILGLRTPLTLRNPEWMQLLEVEYDLSFFDTDPFEPQPGGVMSLWPFRIGRFIELPYTLAQDSTLFHVLGEKTPGLWFRKIDFIRQYQGMALLNSHPDYLRGANHFNIYESFLGRLREQDGYWNPLPYQAARWWRKRTEDDPGEDLPEITLGRVIRDRDHLILC